MGARNEGSEAGFTVITISRDDPSGLARTLASVSAQAAAPLQTVVVRAGRSLDLAFDPRVAPLVSEVPDPALGISAAFNAAIAASRGEWLVFLNGGDAFHAPDSLRDLGACCRANAGADIVACRAATDTGDRIPWRLPRSFTDFLFISHQASAFRRTLFSEVGPYSPDFRVRMDLDWMARYLLRNGHGRIAFVDRVIVDYRLDGISSTNIADFYGEELRVLRRNARFLPALLGFACRRLPERLLREVWGRLAGRR
jgi:glycosyltransferase involved in cell wall biosynthesis